MNILIVYERKNREYENAVLIKYFLEKAGHRCSIHQYYDPEAFKFPWAGSPEIIFVPHLYTTDSVNRIVARFGFPKKIINLQYEQVLSNKWEKLGHHNPKGKAKFYDHICWGPKTAERLKGCDIPVSNLHLIGAPQLDLLNRKFLNFSKAKGALSVDFNLSLEKKWNLFLSSFTYADISDDRLAMNESVAGTELSSFKILHTKTRDKVLEWFETALRQDTSSIFIYRPHPDELNLEKVELLGEKYSNFHVISYNSAKFWIEASDSIFSWYSTTVVESHYMNKNYVILRPFDLPENFDSVLLKRGKFVTTEKEFLALYKTATSTMALKDCDVLDYYINSNDSILAVEHLPDLISKDSGENGVSFSFLELLPHRIKTLIVIFLNMLIKKEYSYIGKKIFNLKFFSDWKNEIVGQRATKLESLEMQKRIRMKVDG